MLQREQMLGAFNQVVVAHPRLKQGLNRLTELLQYAGDARLILILGGTGNGKSTLIQVATKQLAQQAASEMHRDPGYLPFLHVEAPAPENGTFNFRDFYKRCLFAAGEPGVDYKVGTGWTGPTAGNSPLSWGSKRGPSTADLRLALEQCIKYRRIPVVFVDEAQHIIKAILSRRQHDHLDAIKSIAIATKIPWVLSGVYELSVLLERSAQNIRRSHEIHLSRYRLDNDADQTSFQGTLKTLLKNLPVPYNPDIIQEWTYLHECSAGSIGILKGWMMDALRAALLEGSPDVALKHFQTWQRTPHELERIETELREGEDRIARKDAMRQACGSRGRKNDGIEYSSEPTETKPARKSRRRRVGERLPKRDPVGKGRRPRSADHEKPAPLSDQPSAPDQEKPAPSSRRAVSP